MDKDYQICTRCVMDSTIPDIQFDEEGICNYCKEYFAVINRLKNEGNYTLENLLSIFEKVKKEGEKNDYDCLIGLSGGVDSSYLAFVAKKYGLRPLVWHFDNGWDSELAVKNIENIVKKLDLDLITYVVDWEEFRNIQLSFLKASVVDIEMITDHALVLCGYKIAKERDIKYILSGTNATTEFIMPRAWIHWKRDLKNIKAIHKRFGSIKMKTFPQFSLLKYLLYRYFFNIRHIKVLDYLSYNSKEAMSILEKELGFKYYGGKHQESIFTKFYQCYILPEKFKIDKRKAHLSTLICSGQISREEAIDILKNPIYQENKLTEDKEYVLKKLNLSDTEFNEIMHLPIKSHTDYPSNKKLFDFMHSLGNLLGQRFKEKFLAP